METSVMRESWTSCLLPTPTDVVTLKEGHAWRHAIGPQLGGGGRGSVRSWGNFPPMAVPGEPVPGEAVLVRLEGLRAGSSPQLERSGRVRVLSPHIRADAGSAASGGLSPARTDWAVVAGGQRSLLPQDVQSKLKESAQCVGDEFLNCKLATRAKDFLPADIQTQFAVSRELVRSVYNSFHKLRDRAERMAARAIDNAADLLIFGKELSALGSDTTPLPSWAALSSSTWGALKQALKGLSVEFAVLADKAAQQGKQEEDTVVEKLNLFLDLLQAYKDLCERHEKGVLHKHQRALHKYSLMKRQMSAAVHSHEPESVEQLESRIMEQENAIQTMELRNHFSLFCLHQETQLVHAYLPLTSHILGAFVSSQIQGHKEMSKVWNDLKPKLHCLFSGPASALTPPRSPRDGLSPH